MPATIRIKEDNLAIMPQPNHYGHIRITLLAVLKRLQQQVSSSSNFVVETLTWHCPIAGTEWFFWQP